ncbi:MAG: hypothetical protein FWE01_00785 [Firmicutes bacterium]|nr:hypothetical protein [Bacillota bacterium]
MSRNYEQKFSPSERKQYNIEIANGTREVKVFDKNGKDTGKTRKPTAYERQRAGIRAERIERRQGRTARNADYIKSNPRK